VTDENRTIGHQPEANKKNRNHNEELGDFTTTLRVVPISCLAMVKQRLLPVVDAEGKLVGVLTRGDIRDRITNEGDAVLKRPLGDLVRANTVETNPDEILRVIVYRMAEKGVTRLPVVEHSTGKFLGLISLDDLLKARARHLEEERRREQTLNLRLLLPGRRGGAKAKVLPEHSKSARLSISYGTHRMHKEESQAQTSRYCILFVCEELPIK